MQTELYIPPPVENGIVPKNTYGNLDVYTPSMVPVGGVHVIRPSIAHAAHFAGIDYADAVTGFDFVRNKANARINGIVVAQENVEGLLSIWEGMMERVRNEEERLRVRAVLERWKKFFVGMEISRRLDEVHGKVNQGDESDVDVEGDIGQEAFQSDIQHAREFYTGLHHETQLWPTVQVEQIPQSEVLGNSMLSARSKHASDGTLTLKDDQGLYRHLEELENPLNPLAQPMLRSVGPPQASDVEVSGGGFLPENASEGGGFCPPDEPNHESEYSDDFLYEEEDGIL
jgi:Rad4 beta-hairpin domain 3